MIEPLPILRRGPESRQHSSPAEQSHCLAIAEATNRFILGQGTSADLILVNRNRVKHGLEPL